ncbi:MAG: hypothetical protein FWE38_05575 [Firmicutes bacterium]|nr:hypothetical protein [Bacillota bacterium]
MKFTLVQILTVASAIVFLAGGIFMLINVFGGYRWGFWLGLGLAVAACALAGVAYMENKRANPQPEAPTTEQPEITEGNG